MNVNQIKAKIAEYKAQGKTLFTSSSFQTHSIPLLHILSEADRSIPIYFLNTGFHFPETLGFRDQIVTLLGLNLINIRPDTPKIMQLDPDGKLLFNSDPEHCCYLNKTQPMEQVMLQYDVWINGIRGDQNSHRNTMQSEQTAKYGIIRFHPILDWTNKDIYDYRKKYNLPEHPLDSKGYLSIGCEPCTRKLDPEMDEREARWYGLNKTECGLNTDLVKK